MNTLRVALAAVALAAVWLLGYGSYWVLHTPGGGTATADADPAGSVPNWSCMPLNGTTYRCRVARGSPNDFHWQTDGETSTGAVADVDVSEGSATVQLYQKVNGQQILIGTMPLRRLPGLSRASPSPTPSHHSESTPSYAGSASPADSPTEHP